MEAREAVRLRYAMLPYNYTIAFDNSRTGMPLMRPLMFVETDPDMPFDRSSTDMWGPDFLVAPVVEPGATRQEVYFPNSGSVWFDFHTGHDASVASSSGKLYDDDGQSADAFEAGKYEIVRFASKYAGGRLEIGFETEIGKEYAAGERGFSLKIHNVHAKPRAVTIDGRAVQSGWNARHKLLEVAVPARTRQTAKVAITL